MTEILQTESKDFKINRHFNVKSHNDLASSITQIEKCVHGAFGGNITREDLKAHIAGDIVVLGYEKEEIVLFSTALIKSPSKLFKKHDLPDDDNACYMAASAIDRDHQGKGLYHKANRERVDYGMKRGSSLFYTCTQNPRVEEGLRKEFERRIENGEIDSFEVQRIKMPGQYGHMLTAEKPMGKNISFTALNYELGDAYVLLFKIKKLQD